MLREQDVVCFQDGERTLFGHIYLETETQAEVEVLNGEAGEICKIQKDDAVLVPPVQVTEEELRRFVRYECSYRELKKGSEFAPLEAEKPYDVTLEDFRIALENMIRKDAADDEIRANWYFPISESLENCGITERKERETCDEWDGIPNDWTEMDAAWEALGEKFEYGTDQTISQTISQTSGPTISQILEEIRFYEAERNKPLAERRFTGRQKRDFIFHWSSAADRRRKDGSERGSLQNADPVYTALFKQFVEELCAAGDPDALAWKAYACYGDGTYPYGQDWEASTECLLRLMEIAPSGDYANTLGYMYYYGRVNGGVPEYDKAFRYFSIGAAAGLYESRYKLADMYAKGLGVPKIPDITERILTDLYWENFEHICNGAYECKFADVALRFGSMYRDGTAGERNPNVAFFFYLQAKYAIRMRMKTAESYGDRSVAAGIDAAISSILPETDYTKREDTISFHSLEWLISGRSHRTRWVELSIEQEDDGTYSLTFRMAAASEEGERPKMLVTVPEAWYCGQTEQITVTLQNVETLEVQDGDDMVVFDEAEGNNLYCLGENVATIEGDLTLRVPSDELLPEKKTFASVSFEPGSQRLYDYLCDFDVEEGDHVIVDTPYGEKEVVVVRVSDKAETDLALPVDQYKHLKRKVDLKIRHASAADVAGLAEIERECFPPLEAASEEEIADRINAYGDRFWVLEKDGRIVSFVDGMLTDSADLTDEMYEKAGMHDPDGKWQMIFGVNTIPDEQARGYAGMLLNAAIRQSEKEHRAGLVLTCKDRLVHYYASFGFVDEGISESTHGDVEWHQMRLTF